MTQRRDAFLFFALSLLIRLAWLVSYPRVIENEGAQYARLAENIFHHGGYVDMRGPVTMISPLYSMAMGASAFLTPSTELAGRLISLLAGACLPMLLFLIAYQIYGARTGYVAGVLASVHPLLVTLSAAVYSETFYMALLFAGLFATLLVLERTSTAPAIYAGIFGGLAYLTRPEGLAYAFLFALWIAAASWFLRQRDWKSCIARPAILGATSLLLAVPFMIFLTAKTGNFYWEGKSPINDNLMLRLKGGMKQSQANSGLSADMRDAGVGLEDDQFLYARTHLVPLAVKYHLVADGWKQRALSLTRDLWRANFLGSPFLWILCVLGLFAGSWSRLRVTHEGLLCSMAGLLLFILSTMYFIWNRFLFPLLPFAVLWAAHGIAVLYEWGYALFGRKAATWPEKSRVALSWVLPAAGAILLLLVAGRDIPNVGEITEARAIAAKEAGVWLAAHAKERPTVMCVGMVVPYYAAATARLLPYSDAKTALAYLHLKAPDYVVIGGNEVRQRPYLSEWLWNGVPDSCARLVQKVGSRPGDEVAVYQWNCRPPDQTK